MRKLVTLILAVLFLAGSVVPCLAGDPTDQIRETTDKVIDILQSDLSCTEKNKLLEKAVDERFDWIQMSMRALGLQWRKISIAKRAEFVSLFKKLVFNNYIGRLNDYSGEEVRYVDERTFKSRKTGKEYASVKTEIEYNNSLLPIEYRLIKKGDQWLVYEVLIEGVSMIKNYRAQFRGLDFEDIVKWLKDKVG